MGSATPKTARIRAPLPRFLSHRLHRHQRGGGQCPAAARGDPEAQGARRPNKTGRLLQNCFLFSLFFVWGGGGFSLFSTNQAKYSSFCWGPNSSQDMLAQCCGWTKSVRMVETTVRWHLQGESNHSMGLGGAGFHPSTVPSNPSLFHSGGYGWVKCGVG